MNDQKIENLLNISIDVSEAERAKSINLETGYNPATRMWEIIIMYSGTLENLNSVLSKYENITVINLLGNFAIINTPQANIELIARETVIEFIEKPKRLYFEISASKAASCLSAIQTPGNLNLHGKGVITGVIDTGINYRLSAFRNEDGTSRFLRIWDQTAIKQDFAPSPGTVPVYGFGTEYTEEEINASLEASNQTDSASFNVTDLSGHGTAVSRIAAGNDGVASQSSIVFVKMGLSDEDSFPRTTQLMCAIDYIIRTGIEYEMPVAINISFGNNYGDHTGTSLLETYINSVSFAWKSCICIGTGNEADAATHASGTFADISGIPPENAENLSAFTQSVDFIISPYERNINLQLWHYYWDDIRLAILSPSGRRFEIPDTADNVIRLRTDNTLILIYNGQPSPFSIMQETYFDFIPENEYIGSGIWQIQLIPVKILSGSYNMWLPSAGAINPSTGFLSPDSEKTFTIPSTASRAISVGAYNALNNSYAAFSGRGYTLSESGFATSKPDICAPGVSVVVGNRAFTGTSFATPFVTGSAALLMEWGIVRGNDPFLYGEKLKAYLISGAKKLPGTTDTPNALTGWGALCVQSSLPV